MKMIMLMVVLGTILSTSVRGQNCTEVTACDGTKVTLGDGSCYTRKSPCDDGYSCSSDSCTARSGVCSRSTSGGSCPVCKVGCVPDCTGKQCGENGCGGFCGVCPTGEGCSNGVCSVAGASGTCSKPYELTTDPITASVDITVTGDTTTAVHIHTPSCNYLSASPEVFYKFTIPAGKTFGFDMRLTGYDTVLSLLKDRCDDPTYTQQCSDDATPPGNYGSAIYGKISEGTYFLQVDGYDSTALGPFELKIRFKENCQPLCDGAFCGSDGCGSVCGTCESYQTCNSAARCFNTSCVPKCGSAYNRTCGEDGCGGSCGTCVSGYSCYGASIQPDDPENNPDEIPGSVCVANPTCNHFNPTCTPACGSNEFCSTRCRCLHKDTKLPDFVVLVDDLINDMKTHKITVPSSSCTLIEKCVGGAGERNLLRFTGASANQGQADFTPPFPKTNPDQFTWGTCHQHYHYRDFMRYSLHKVTGAVVKDGGKAAFCMEDSRRHLDGPGVGCDKKYECGHQGIQAGWADSYGWSLDCSWLDVTGLPAGDYVVRLEVNPSKSIEEDSYTNNLACVRVSIPEESSFTGVPATLAGGVQVSCDQYNFNTSGAAPLSTALLLLTLVASLALMIF